MKFKSLAQIIERNYYFPKYSKWVFVLLFVTISAIYNYQNILFKPPQSIHQWRQCDCLSITMNYYQDNNAFLEPSIHYLGDGSGKTISEFPLIYYSIAQLWKIFGYHEFIYRLIVLLFFFTGLFALFKIFEEVIKDSYLAIGAVLLLFTSPTLAYYANNFLMDMIAFSLALVGLYFFYRFYKSSKYKHLLLFSFFYALAGLLKVSSLLSFVAILCLFFLELIKVKLKPEGKIFKQPFRQILILLSVLMVQFVWYKYALNYNNKHNAGLFLIGILPIWDLNISQIKLVIDGIAENIKLDYFRRETQIVFVLMFFVVLYNFKRINKTIFFLMLFIFFGFIVFVLLFFQVLDVHDYYVINLFILIPVILLAFLMLTKERFGKFYSSWIFHLIILIFLFHNIDFARRRINNRYKANGWENSEYFKYIKPFREINPYLLSIGIKKDDKVISLSDHSPNITLYLMNHKGWTKYGTASDSVIITEGKKLGAKYLFISKPETYNNSVRFFIKNKIGNYKNIDIYSLKAN